MSVIKLTNENFITSVKESKKCLVDFYAVWCGPCEMLSPLVDKLSEENDSIDFFKVDVDECPDIAAKYGISSIPALFILKNGDIAEKSIGYMTEDKLRAFVEKS